MKARGMTREQVMNDVLLAAQPTKQFVTARTGRRAGGVPVPRRGGVDHGREHDRRRRLDRGMTIRRRPHRPIPARGRGGSRLGRIARGWAGVALAAALLVAGCAGGRSCWRARRRRRT